MTFVDSVKSAMEGVIDFTFMTMDSRLRGNDERRKSQL